MHPAVFLPFFSTLAGGFAALRLRHRLHADPRLSGDEADTAAEVVRAALRLLEGHDVPEGLPSDAEIRAMVEEGDASGVVDEDPAIFFDDLRARLAAMPPGEEERRGG